MVGDTKAAIPLGYVVHVRTPGRLGGETRSYQVAQALTTEGMNVHLYGQVERDFPWARGVYPHVLARPTPSAIVQLVGQFNHFKIDVAIERYHFPIFNAGFFAQYLRKKPLILEVHGFPIDEFRLMKRSRVDRADFQIRALTAVPDGWWERLQRWLFLHTDHFIVTSAGSKEALVRLGVAARRISVVYNCVDPAMFDPQAYDAEAARRRWRIPPDVRVALCAGTLSHEEIETLIQAIGLLRRRRSDVLLLLVGKGERAHLVQIAQAAGLSRQEVQFLDPVSHQAMPELLAAADVVVAPYTLASERFRYGFHYSPLKVLEALAMAKPIVTVRAQELQTLFGALPNLHFAESGSGASWAEQIAAALERVGSPALHQGRAFVLDGYRWRDAAQSYRRIIEAVRACAR